MDCMSGDQITNSEFNQANPTIKKTFRKFKKVDINILLKKVRVEQRKEKFENTIFFGLVAMSIVVTGIIVSL